MCTSLRNTLYILIDININILGVIIRRLWLRFYKNMRVKMPAIYLTVHHIITHYCKQWIIMWLVIIVNPNRIYRRIHSIVWISIRYCLMLNVISVIYLVCIRIIYGKVYHCNPMKLYRNVGWLHDFYVPAYRFDFLDFLDFILEFIDY